MFDVTYKVKIVGMLMFMPMQRFLLLQPTRKLSYIKYGTGRFVKRNVTFYSFGEEIST